MRSGVEGHARRWRGTALADAASVVEQAGQSCQGWTTIADAISWYTSAGAKADEAGETLLLEDPDLPHALTGARALLRQAYQRLVDTANVRFSDLLADQGLEAVASPRAGQAIEAVVNGASGKSPVAVMFLDALRYELGERLARSVNQGRYGRMGKGKIYAFGRERGGKTYPHKRVEVYYQRETERIVTVTVYVFYGHWEQET